MVGSPSDSNVKRIDLSHCFRCNNCSAAYSFYTEKEKEWGERKRVV